MNANETDSPGGVASQIPQANQRVIYEYVHTHGPVDREEIRQELFEYDRRAFEYNLAQLARDNHVLIEDDTVRIALDLKSVGEPATIDLPSIDSSVTIRPPRQRDRPAVVETMREVAGNGTHVEAETVAQRVESEQCLHRNDENQIRVFFVGTIDDDISGWVHLTASPRQQLQHTARLTGGVLESHRQSGLGSRLIEHGLDWADSQGYEKVYQHVPATNLTAIDFLKNRGWTIEATRDDHYLNGGEYIDELLFAYEFDN